MDRLNAFDWVVAAILWIGAILLGMLGFFEYDLLSELFGASSATSRIIEAVIGLAAIEELVSLLAKSARPHSIMRGHEPAHL